MSVRRHWKGCRSCRKQLMRWQCLRLQEAEFAIRERQHTPWQRISFSDFRGGTDTGEQSAWKLSLAQLFRDHLCVGGQGKLFCKRAGIEPTIGHLKSDYRLGRNFYKGLLGDAINVMLAAAAYNFKRAMKVLMWLLEKISETLIKENLSLKYTF